MKIRNLLEKADQLIGQSIELEGFLVLTFDSSYFIDSIDARDIKSEAVELDVPNLKKILMARVPPSGGSEYFYLDKAQIKGRLENSSTKEFAFTLQSLTSLIIEKSGMTFTVIS